MPGMGRLRTIYPAIEAVGRHATSSLRRRRLWLTSILKLTSQRGTLHGYVSTRPSGAHLAVGGELKIAAITWGHFPARAGADRTAFLSFTVLVWLGVLSGFGTDSFDHIKSSGWTTP